MTKRTLIIIAMAGIYVWIRRLQHSLAAASRMENHQAEAEWANEGGANPAASV